MTRDRLGETAAWVVFSLGAFVFGGATLERMVYLPNWLHNPPQSLVTTQAFLAVGTPGDFFQLFVPLLLLATLAGAALCWPRRRAALALLAGFGLLVAAEGMTFLLVYPRIGDLLSPEVVTMSPAEIQSAADSLVFWGFEIRLTIMFAAIFGCYLYAARGMTRWSVKRETAERSGFGGTS